MPRPAVNLILYHGILAQHARWRAQVAPSPASNANICQYDITDPLVVEDDADRVRAR